VQGQLNGQHRAFRSHPTSSATHMSVRSAGSKPHWNYFLALERDLEVVSRYVEFSPANEATFSIELARLLFAAASEVDVLAKLVCAQIAPREKPATIDAYKPILLGELPSLPTTTVRIPRYGLSFDPWTNWSGKTNPDWWQAYNKVKHKRDAHFDLATLKNAWNSLGALLIICVHYYSRHLASQPGQRLELKDATHQLEPESSLLRLDESLYYSHLVV
jgi:hypothetical protein